MVAMRAVKAVSESFLVNPDFSDMEAMRSAFLNVSSDASTAFLVAANSGCSRGVANGGIWNDATLVTNERRRKIRVCRIMMLVCESRRETVKK